MIYNTNLSTIDFTFVGCIISYLFRRRTFPDLTASPNTIDNLLVSRENNLVVTTALADSYRNSYSTLLNILQFVWPKLPKLKAIILLLSRKQIRGKDAVVDLLKENLNKQCWFMLALNKNWKYENHQELLIRGESWHGVCFYNNPLVHLPEVVSSRSIFTQY